MVRPQGGHRQASCHTACRGKEEGWRQRGRVCTADSEFERSQGDRLPPRLCSLQPAARSPPAAQPRQPRQPRLDGSIVAVTLVGLQAGRRAGGWTAHAAWEAGRAAPLQLPCTAASRSKPAVPPPPPPHTHTHHHHHHPSHLQHVITRVASLAPAARCRLRRTAAASAAATSAWVDCVTIIHQRSLRRRPGTDGRAAQRQGCGDAVWRGWLKQIPLLLPDRWLEGTKHPPSTRTRSLLLHRAPEAGPLGPQTALHPPQNRPPALKGGATARRPRVGSASQTSPAGGGLVWHRRRTAVRLACVP